MSEDYEFPLYSTDTIVVFTLNRTCYEEKLITLTSKMVIIKEQKDINLNDLSLILGSMGIENLNIFSIHANTDIKTTVVFSNKHSNVKYTEIYKDSFVELLNFKKFNFMDYYKNSLFIVRGGNFIDIKNLFAVIENQTVNIGRGGSQKAHALSPLDFRLSSYLMAMFNFDYNLISSLNSFNIMTKDRYLTYMDKSRPIKFVRVNLDNNK